MQNFTSNLFIFLVWIVFNTFNLLFYRHYDAEKDFERMRKLGLFSSCPADD